MQYVQPIAFIGARRATRFSISCDFVVRFVPLLEIFTVVLAAAAARVLYSGLSSIQSDDLAIGTLAGFVFVLVGRHRGLFRIDCLTSFLSHAQTLFSATSASVFAVLVVFFFTKTGSNHSRVALSLFYVLAVSGVFLQRAVTSKVLHFAIEAGALNGRPVVMIGEAEEFSGVDSRGLLNFGIDELARFELSGRGSSLEEPDRQLISKAMRFARMSRAREFALIINWRRGPALDEILDLLRESPLPVRLYPDTKARDVLQKHRGGDFNPYLSIELQREPLRWRERAAKRVLDLSIALSGLILLSPILLMTALLIKLESEGPVIFRQRRIGFDRRVFTIFKFRTMTVQEDGDSLRQAQKGDARITTIGKLLRQASIDELPQLWNVVRGEMSLVGPRPHALAHDEEYSRKIAEYARRHHVKPGLTGAAQVRGFRGETRTLKQMADRVEWDLWYINNWNFFLDIRIVLRTFVALACHDAF